MNLPVYVCPTRVEEPDGDMMMYNRTGKKHVKLWNDRYWGVTIRHLGPSYSAINTIASQAEQDLGFAVEMVVENGIDLVNMAINDPESIDIVDIDYWAYKLILPEGVLQGIPLAKYKWWNETHPIFTKGTYGNGNNITTHGVYPYSVQYLEKPDSTEFAATATDTLCMIPHMMNADTLGVRKDLIGRPIESWAELINPEFKGRTALVNIPDIGIMDAAMAFEAAGKIKYKDKGNMTTTEIDETISLLTELKRMGHFHNFWSTFEESVNSFSLGKVVIQSMWYPAVSEVAARGIECDYPALREGYRGWASGLGIMRHLEGEKLEAAYEYLNWYNSGWVGAYIAREGYYSPVPGNTRNFLTKNEWDYWYEGMPASESIINLHGRIEAHPGDIRMGGSFSDRIGKIACWNTVMNENDYLIRRWHEFMNR